jgi:hypothetical protein
MASSLNFAALLITLLITPSKSVEHHADVVVLTQNTSDVELTKGYRDSAREIFLDKVIFNPLFELCLHLNPIGNEHIVQNNILQLPSKSRIQ